MPVIRIHSLPLGFFCEDLDMTVLPQLFMRLVMIVGGQIQILSNLHHRAKGSACRTEQAGDLYRIIRTQN